MKRIFALLMCLVLGVACLTGCSNSEEAFTQKSYTADEEKITEVYIDVWDRQIEVMLSDDNQIHIEYFENSKEFYDISISDGHVLKMVANEDKDWKDYIGTKSNSDSRKILLQLPNALLTTLDLSTTNENISLPSMTVADNLTISSQGGSVVFDKLNVENSISLNAKNGDISGTIIGSYDDYAISCNIKKGDSNLPLSKENGIKTLTVSNNNGDIDIEFINE